MALWNPIGSHHDTMINPAPGYYNPDVTSRNSGRFFPEILAAFRRERSLTFLAF
jgi:hypothetical protein